MDFDGDKRALFVIGMDQELQSLLQHSTTIKSENILTLQTYGPEISQPYGDLMRDILLAVYQDNVEDIFLVGTKEEQRDVVDMRALQTKIGEQDAIKEKIETIDFLFKHCMPELSGVTFHEWLEGSKTVIEGIQKSVRFLRDHPLLPSYLRVSGLLIDKESGELTEIQVS